MNHVYHVHTLHRSSIFPSTLNFPLIFNFPAQRFSIDLQFDVRKFRGILNQVPQMFQVDLQLKAEDDEAAIKVDADKAGLADGYV